MGASYGIGLILLMTLIMLMLPVPLVSAPPVALRVGIARSQSTDTTHPRPEAFEINPKDTPYSVVVVKGQIVLVNSTKLFFSRPDTDHAVASQAEANDMLMALVIMVQAGLQPPIPAHYAPMSVKPTKGTYNSSEAR
jgi:hypothetical protein